MIDGDVASSPMRRCANGVQGIVKPLLVNWWDTLTNGGQRLQNSRRGWQWRFS